MSESTFWTIVLIGAVVLLAALAVIFRQIMRMSVPADPDDDEPVAILSGRTELEAEVFRSKLEASGIMAFVKAGGWFAPTMWYRPLVGWQVLVRYGDRFAAEECLEMRLATSDEPHDVSEVTGTPDAAEDADSD